MDDDDLPWPEFDNISRGITRGNQGSKGALGPSDAAGCAILQLRVQPGVLVLKLNRQSTEWYRMLNDDVQAALRLSKTHWRKARRRQDYDARADHDHMELHEWLQQLKDKCITYAELLIQKGEVQGRPYVMPNNIQFNFVQKFIERRANGIPHNPRLRGLPRDEQHHPMISDEDMEGSDSSGGGASMETSEASSNQLFQRPHPSAFRGGPVTPSSSPMSSPSKSITNGDVIPLPNTLSAIVARIDDTNHSLRRARALAAAARRSVKDAHAQFSTAVETADRAEQDVQRVREQLDELMPGLPPTLSFAEATLPSDLLQHLGSGHGPPPQAHVLDTPSFADSLVVPYGNDPCALFYEQQQLQLQHSHSEQGMTMQHSYSSFRGAFPRVQSLAIGQLMGLNSTPEKESSRQQQTFLGGKASGEP